MKASSGFMAWGFENAVSVATGQSGNCLKGQLSVVSASSRLSFHPAAFVAAPDGLSFCSGTAVTGQNDDRFARTSPCRPQKNRPLALPPPWPVASAIHFTSTRSWFSETTVVLTGHRRGWVKKPSFPPKTPVFDHFPS